MILLQTLRFIGLKCAKKALVAKKFGARRKIMRGPPGLTPQVRYSLFDLGIRV